MILAEQLSYTKEHNDNVFLTEFSSPRKKKVLKKRKSFVEQILRPNTKYIIKHDYDLDGDTLVLPDNCELIFKGGSIDNGFLVGPNASIYASTENIGILSSSEADSQSTLQKLSMISGIKNVTLELSSDLYLARKSDVRFKNLYIKGNAKRIFLNNFSEFSVENLKMADCNVFSVGNRNSSLFRLPMYEGSPVIIFKNNYFTGDLRLITSDFKSLDKKYRVDLFDYTGNRADNIYCSKGSNVFVMFPNTLYEDVVIADNVIHNFTCNVFDLACTNDTQYAVIAKAWAEEIGRNVSIENNHIYNDLSFTHWNDDSITDSGTYFCLVVCEYGTCRCENNVFENIIANNKISNCYDNYLSVSDLLYRNNSWKNILNLGSKDNRVLLKSKMGRGVRTYTDNKYLLEDMSSVYGIQDIGLMYTSIFDFQDDIESFEFYNNNIDLAGLYLNAYIGNECKRFVFKDNVINIGQVNLGGSPSYFTVPSRDDFYMEIVNNKIHVREGISSMSTNKEMAFIGDLSKDVINGTFVIKNNNVDLCKILYSGINQQKFYKGEFLNNQFISDNHNDNRSECFVTYFPQGVTLRNNKYLYKESRNNTSSVFYIVRRFNTGLSFVSDIRFDSKPSSIILFRGASQYGQEGMYKLKISIKSADEHYLYEYNFQLDKDGTATYYGYDKGGKLGRIMTNSELPNMAPNGVDQKAPFSLNHGLRGDFLKIGVDYRVEASIEPIGNIEIMHNSYTMNNDANNR